MKKTVITFYLLVTYLSLHSQSSYGNMKMASGFIMLIIYVAIIIALFFALRQVVLWYFKINKRVELLTEIKQLLLDIKRNTSDIPIETLSKSDEKINTEKDNDLTTQKEKFSKEPEFYKTITIKHKKGREETVSIKQWERIKAKYGEENYTIISFNQ